MGDFGDISPLDLEQEEKPLLLLERESWRAAWKHTPGAPRSFGNTLGVCPRTGAEVPVPKLSDRAQGWAPSAPQDMRNPVEQVG